MSRVRNTLHRSRGMTYITILFVVATVGIGAASLGEVWQTVSIREKETELLFIGDQYRKAIERYFAAGRQYPRRLEDLLKDPRRPNVERHLRRLYPDPITGSSTWGIVAAPDGAIMGVYSLAEGAPLKVSGFKASDRAFEGAQRYSDWKFVAGFAIQPNPPQPVRR